MNIGDKMWHPCNLDIIEYKVISIREFDGFRHYVLRSEYNVGACGNLDIVISHCNDRFVFIELIDEEEIEHASGLGDLIEGNYYKDKDAAKVEFYTQQLHLSRSNMENKRRLYESAKAKYEKIKLIINTIKK